MAKESSKHLAFLDGVRGIAALYVVLHHAAINLPSTVSLGAGEVVFRRLVAQGHYAVDVFIVLSGYCLMLPFLDGRELSVVTFLKRRAWRILPPYYAATAVSLLLIWTVLGEMTGTHWDVCLPVSSADIVYHGLLIQDWTDAAPKINHVLWSVGVEWKIYFLFPILLLWLRRQGGLKVAIVATLAGYTAWLVCLRTGYLNPTAWGSSFYYVGLFALGMYAADLAERLAADASSRGLQRAALGLLSLGVLAISTEHAQWILVSQVRSLFVGVWTVSLLVALRTGASPRWLTALLTSRPAASSGRIAYSLYLIHAPVLQLVFLYLVRPFLARPFRTPLMVAASTLASLGVATLFYRLVELPFHQRSRAVSAQRRPLAAPTV